MKFSILLLNILLIHSLSFSQICNYDSVELKIKLVNDTINSLTPIFYNLSFTNKKTKKIKIIAPWDEKHVLPYLEIKYEKDEKWERLPLSNYGNGHYYTGEWGRSEIDLDANQTIYTSSYWIAAPFSQSGIWLDHMFFNQTWNALDFVKKFKRLGKYSIRASIYDCLDKKIIFYSNEVQLIVENYDRDNIDAMKWLEDNLPYPACIYISNIENTKAFNHFAPVSYRETGVKTDKILYEYVELFPNNLFTPWVKLYLSQWLIMGFDYKPDLYKSEIEQVYIFQTLKKVEKAKGILKEVKKYAVGINDKLMLEYIKQQEEYINDHIRLWRAQEEKRNQNK